MDAAHASREAADPAARAAGPSRATQIGGPAHSATSTVAKAASATSATATSAVATSAVGTSAIGATGHRAAVPAGRRDLGSRSRELLGLQRIAGNAIVARLVQSRSAAAVPSAPPPVQRSSAAHTVPSTGPSVPSIQRSEETEKAFKAIHYQAMFALLPTVAALPAEVRADEQTAQFVGGPRLVLAIRATQSKGNWQAFASANVGELAGLPIDQIDDIMRYVGAPAEVRTFDRSKFDNRFDALVDPTTGTITLIMRIKIEMLDSQSYSGHDVGSKGWQDNNIPEFKKFGPRMKSVIESAWSGTGSVKPVTKGLKVPTFATRVSVQIVDSGEHICFKLYGGTSGVRSNVNQTLKPGATSRTGELHIGDNDPKPTSLEHRDHTKVSSQQITSAHEFGHAMGLQHVRCAGDGVCYGINQTEYGSIMGGGMSLAPVTVGEGKGAHVHDNLVPFEKIGEAWGKEVFPPALAAKLSVWGPA